MSERIRSYRRLQDEKARKRWLDIRFSKRVLYLILSYYLKQALPICEQAYPENKYPRLFVEHLENVADQKITLKRNLCDKVVEFQEHAFNVMSDFYKLGLQDIHRIAAYISEVFEFCDEKTVKRPDLCLSHVLTRMAGFSYHLTDFALDDLEYFMEIEGWSLQWHTADAIGMAASIYENKAWDRCPILADALMDAGCENALVLHMLTKEYNVFHRGFWVLDKLLGKI